ncbi:hypothetical protein FB451DRAFT_1284591 [Mycena latifolia]|nr:hypothetical protein FB451DRAFT_1284591 [Mycena latifolia]
MDNQATHLAATLDQIAYTAGPLFIGVLMTWLLMGVYMMQAHFYFMTYNDPCFIRGLVITISALEITQWILSTSSAWHFLIQSWGNISGYFDLPREAFLSVLLCGISSMIVQTFFAWRIWILAYGNWLLRIAAILIQGSSLMQGCLSIVSVVFFLVNPANVALNRHYKVFEASLIGAMVADTLISLCMLYLLFKARKGAPRPSPKLVLNQLIVDTFKTGCATTIIAVVTFALLKSFRDRGYEGATYIFLQKLYAISLLTNLNARQRTAGGAEESVELNFSDVIIQTSTETTDAASGVSYPEHAERRGTPAHSLRAMPMSIRSSILKTFTPTFRTRPPV